MYRQSGKTLRVVLFAVTLLAAAFCIRAIRDKTRTVSLFLTNNTSENLEQVLISYAGGPIQAGSLTTGETVLFNIRTANKSVVELKCSSSAGDPIQQEIIPSLEPGNGGSIRVTIADSSVGFDIDIDRKIYKYPIW